MAMNPRLLRPLATGFNPRQISGLFGWWDASVSSSVTLNGSNVSAWADLSGNSRNASQGTAASQPAYSSTINGRNVITFSGSQWLRTTSFSLAQPATYLLVCRSSKTTGGATDRSYVFDGSPTTPQSTGRHLLSLYGANTGFVSYYAGLNFSQSTTAISTSALVASVVFNGSSSAMHIDGTAAASGSAGTNTLENGITIGANQLASSDFLSGDVAELVVYDRALSASERQRVERALGRKWGITVA